MDRTLTTRLKAQVRVVITDDGELQLGVLSENQDALATLGSDERDQIVGWLQDPGSPLVVR